MSINTLKTLTMEHNSAFYWRSNDKRGLIFDMNSSTYGAIFEGSNILSDTIKEGE